MLWLFLLIVIAILVIKFIKLITFWNDQDIPHENFFEAFYRNTYKFNKFVIADELESVVKRYGKLFTTFRGLKPSLFISDIELIKDVTHKQFQNFFKRSIELETGDALWDNMLLMLPHDGWKQMRQVMSNCFTSAKLKSIVPKFDPVASRVAVKLRAIAESDQNELTLKKTFQGYAMDSVICSSFGVDLQCTEDAESQFVKYASDLFSSTVANLVAAMCPGLMKYLPFVYYVPKASSKFFREFGAHIIEEKRKNLDQVAKNGTADIMDNILIALHDDPNVVVTDEMLASQVFTLLVAGIDTTVVALEMATYFMTICPEVQETMYQEVKQTMGSRTDVTFDDVVKLKYMEATIYESLRMYPITLIMDRICVNDTVLSGIPVKKGTLIEIPVMSIHYDPEVFPEPAEFRPERFLEENNKDPQGYLTFGDGPKNCIGRRLAIMGMQVFLARLLLSVKLEKAEKTPTKLEWAAGVKFTDVTKDPLVLKLTPRE